jgi:hypothetical protein
MNAPANPIKPDRLAPVLRYMGGVIGENGHKRQGQPFAIDAQAAFANRDYLQRPYLAQKLMSLRRTHTRADRSFAKNRPVLFHEPGRIE